jgi:hypothetical protein
MDYLLLLNDGMARAKFEAMRYAADLRNLPNCPPRSRAEKCYQTVDRVTPF